MTRRAVWLLAVCASLPASAQTLRRAASVRLPAEVAFVKFSPTGNQMAVSSRDGKLRLVALPSGEIQGEIDLGNQRLTRMVYAGSGRWIAFGDLAGSVTITSASPGERTRRTWSVSKRRIGSLALSHDGTRLAVAGLDEPGEIWNVAREPKRGATLHSNFSGPFAMAFSPVGRLLLVADGDTVVRLYETDSGKQLAANEEFLLDSFAAEFTLDGKQVLVGGADRTLTVLDKGTLEVLKKMPAQKGAIRALLPMPDGAHVAALYFSADDPRNPTPVLIWDLRSGSSRTASDDRQISAVGLVGSELWLASVEGKTVELLKLQE